MDYWAEEVRRWNPNISMVVVILNQPEKKRIIEIRRQKYTKNCIFITTPNIISKLVDIFRSESNLDVMIIDEGHKAKNIHTKVRKGLKDIYVKKQKILLTGTPVQNNLNEFFSLVDIIQDGILGTFSEFKAKFSSVIERGLKKNAVYKQMSKA